MLRALLRAKLHRLTVTDRKIEYEGSLTIGADLLKAADILPGERVQVVNVNNGARFETYILEGESGSGVVCLNGAAARLAEIGDVVIVIAYGYLEEGKISSFKPKIVLVDSKNKIKKIS
jgi:aspartate 1-decarboxylase